MPSPPSYDFRKEQIHLVNPNAGGGVMTFRCHRCERTLAQESFGVVRTPRDLDANFIDRTTTIIALHPWCWTCRKQDLGQWTGHPDYSPALDRYFSRMMDGVRGGAKSRGLACFIDKDDVIGLFFRQEQRCAVTGMKMDWRSLSGKQGLKAKDAPSVDRIHSGGNYSLGNIQLVLAVVNIMKNDMSMPTFVEMCRRVTAFSDKAHTAKAA